MKRSSGLLTVVVVLVLASQAALVAKNLQLRKRLTQAADNAQKLSALEKDATNVFAANQLRGRCAPILAGETAASDFEPIAGRYFVALYFSLERDCLFCVKNEIAKWNELLAQPLGEGLKVVAYTKIDGTLAQETVDRDLAADFPVVHIPDFDAQIAEQGFEHTPVVVVGDARTGRTLSAHLPVLWQTEDRSFVDGFRSMLETCGS